MRERRWLLLALYGILLAHAVTAALKATRPKFKIATTSTTTTTTTEEIPAEDSDDTENLETTTVSADSNATTGHTLTGIPQIDYIWDPNLPRELNGYNLSDYPFYNSIPEDIDFKCDGLHDGFYASVPHKCQVYHHCLYGTRYDFLCANFTAFDQRTFICHFVSEVDCANSKKYWHRNDALYKATTTSTTSTSTTTTTTVAPATVAASRPVASRDRDALPPPRRRRPFRRRPAYDYYDEEYYDDEYGRPRGYDRRDDYEYEDRKYRRDRDRDFRDRERDFREREPTRPRDIPARDDRDPVLRDRFPPRSNRRDPPTRPRDPTEEEPRPRSRPQDPPMRPRDTDDTEFEDRRTDPRTRDPEDRRYMDKRFRDEYEEKDSPVIATPASTEGLVKPAAPSASVYSRPRTPPKIRRPVPLSEQDRFAYKAPATQPAADESRRRPADLVEEEDYYEDDLEEVRPRRPIRRRPMYRDREREFYDVRDRPFRPRYRDEEDDIRPRKHQDRPRDRYYDRERDRGLERGRDRSLDRGKDRPLDRPLDRDRARPQDVERPERPYVARPIDREREEGGRSRSSSRSKDLSDEPPRRQNVYDRTTEKSATTSSTVSSATTTCMPEALPHSKEQESKVATLNRDEESSHADRPIRPIQNHGRLPIDEEDSSRDLREKAVPLSQPDYQEKLQEDRHVKSQPQAAYADEYSSEYYDEPEETPAPPPRPAVRIVKRPFLPSRGGNPNPRGLSAVGIKAANAMRRDEDRSTERNLPREDSRGYYAHTQQREPSEEPSREYKGKDEDGRPAYDAYKVIQTDIQQKQRPEEYESTVPRTPARGLAERIREEEPQKSLEDNQSPSRGPANQRQAQSSGTLERDPPVHQWTAEDSVGGKESNYENSSIGSSSRGKVRGPPAEQTNYYGSTYKNEEVGQEQPTGPSSLRAKQRINEVTHRLQDIPESEYDVTLNDALTPTLNQESSLPSGFVLPFHRPINRDAVLQPSENSYKISRPTNQQQQQQQQQQQKPFVPSPQFLPAGNERSRSTVFFRTPEAVQVSNSQYRSQRGPWQDYTGY